MKNAPWNISNLLIDKQLAYILRMINYYNLQFFLTILPLHQTIKNWKGEICFIYLSRVSDNSEVPNGKTRNKVSLQGLKILKDLIMYIKIIIFSFLVCL